MRDRSRKRRRELERERRRGEKKKKSTMTKRECMNTHQTSFVAPATSRDGIKTNPMEIGVGPNQESNIMTLLWILSMERCTGLCEDEDEKLYNAREEYVCMGTKMCVYREIAIYS